MFWNLFYFITFVLRCPPFQKKKVHGVLWLRKLNIWHHPNQRCLVCMFEISDFFKIPFLCSVRVLVFVLYISDIFSLKAIQKKKIKQQEKHAVVENINSYEMKLANCIFFQWLNCLPSVIVIHSALWRNRSSWMEAARALLQHMVTSSSSFATVKSAIARLLRNAEWFN